MELVYDSSIITAKTEQNGLFKGIKLELKSQFYRFNRIFLEMNSNGSENSIGIIFYTTGLIGVN